MKKILHNKTILLVDDESEIRDLLATELVRVGATVLHSIDGKEGLEILQRKAVDLIIADYRMPEMDGIGLTKVVREELQLQTPIILVSGFHNFSDSELTDHGVSCFLSKPFRWATILEKIKSIFSEANQNSSDAEGNVKIAA